MAKVLTIAGPTSWCGFLGILHFPALAPEKKRKDRARERFPGSPKYSVPHPFHGFIVKWVGQHEPATSPYRLSF